MCKSCEENEYFMTKFNHNYCTRISFNELNKDYYYYQYIQIEDTKSLFRGIFSPTMLSNNLMSTQVSSIASITIEIWTNSIIHFSIEFFFLIYTKLSAFFVIYFNDCTLKLVGSMNRKLLEKYFIKYEHNLLFFP